MSPARPIRVDDDEVAFEADLPLDRINGWQAGQLAQHMGKDLKRFLGDLEPGQFHVRRAAVRVSVWLDPVDSDEREGGE